MTLGFVARLADRVLDTSDDPDLCTVAAVIRDLASGKVTLDQARAALPQE